MLRLLLAPVVCLLAFSAPYSLVSAATPLEEPALQLTTEILRQRYCEGDSELDGLDLELRLRYRNVGSQPLILYKGSEDVYQVKVSSGPADAARGKYEVNASLTRYTDAGAWEASESSLNRMFVILRPGETYEAKTRARVFVTREGVRRKIEGSVGNGEHYLQVTIPTWHSPQELAERLRKKWGRKGFLWTTSVTSLPMAFTVEPKRTAEDCK